MNTAGNQTGIYMNGMGAGTGTGARDGSVINNLWIDNFSKHGIYLLTSSNNIIRSNVINEIDNSGVWIQGGGGSHNNQIVGNKILASSYGINVANQVNNNIISNNLIQDIAAAGLSVYLGTGNTITGNNIRAADNGMELDNVDYSTITGNIIKDSTNRGIYLYQSDSNAISGNDSMNNAFTGIELTGSFYNTVSGNAVRGNADSGIYLGSGNNNSVTGNVSFDNGSAANNNGIWINSSDNVVTGNNISDSSSTTSNYAIRIGGNNNYLANNTLGGGTINDSGTGTIYGGQVDVSGNYRIQPTGTIELLKNTNVTGTLTVSGLTTLNGGLTVETGDTFTFNGDAFTDLTGNGLQVTSNALTLSLQANKGLEVDGNGLSLIDCSTNEILKYNGSSQWACATDGAGSGVTTIGTIDSQTKSSDGAVISGNSIYLQTADATYPGLVSTGTQSFAGAKTFDDNLIANGNVDLGDATSDTVTFTGRVDSDILPSTDDTYDLGSSTLRWQDLYLGPNSLHIGTSGNEATISYVTGTNTLTLTAANTNISNTLAVDGNTTLGDSTSDTTTIAGDLTINPLVSCNNVYTDQSGLVSCGGGIENAVTKIEVSGHSIAFGVGASNYATTAFSRKLAAMLHAQERNISRGGAVVSWDESATGTTSGDGGYARVLQKIKPTATQAPYLPMDGIGVVEYGLNDTSYLGNGVTTPIENGLRTVIARYLAGAVFEDNDPSVSYTGTWGTTGATRFNSGTSFTSTATNGDSYTISVPSDFPGGTIDIGLIAESNGNSGTYTFTVDGSAAGSVSTSGQAASSHSTGMVYRITGLSSGAHTIVGTVSAVSGATHFDYWQIESEKPRIVLLPSSFRAYDYSTVFGGRPYTPTDSDITDLNNVKQSLASEFGSNVIYVDLDSAINKQQVNFSSDGVHPNDRGYSLIANELYKALVKAPFTSEDLSYASAIPINYQNNVTFRNNNDTATAFQIQNANGTSLFNVDSTTGFVGIGTSSPGNLLDLQASTNTIRGVSIKNSSSGTGAVSAVVYTNDINAVGYTGLASSNYATIPILNNRLLLSAATGTSGVAINTSVASTDIVFGINNVEAARISSSRNFGIGTSTPQSKLHVANVSTAYPWGIVNAQHDDAVSGALFVGRKSRGTPTAPTAVQNGDIGATFASDFYDGTSYVAPGYFGYVVDNSVSTGSVPAAFTIRTGGGSFGLERLRVTSAGNVGIGGDTTPDALFSVGATSQFQIDSSGNILTAGNLNIQNNTTIGNANTDTLTINAGSSGSGISFSDASFQTCTLKTDASGVLTCGTDATGTGTVDTTGTPATNQVAYFSDANTIQGSTGFTYDGTDLAVDTDTLFVDGTNHRVGIGTNNPTRPLEIFDASPVLLLHDSDSTGNLSAAQLRFEDSSNSTFSVIGHDSNSQSQLEIVNNIGDIQFKPGGILGSGTPVATASASGKFGIGDASPAYLLTVGNGDLFGVNSSGNLLFEGATVDANQFTIAVADPTADRTYTIPDSPGNSTDTFCLLTLGNCSGSATTLQASYDADVNGGDAVIALTSADGGVIIRDNATPLGTTLFAVQDSAGTTSYLNVNATGVTVAGTLSVPGTGAISEQFGANADASGSHSTAVGASARAIGNYGVAVGQSAFINTGNINAVAVGYNSSVTGDGGVSIGKDATGSGVQIGQGASTGNGSSVAIGYGSTTSTYGVAIGGGASTTATNAIALGFGATAGNNQFVIGNTTSAYFGGVTSATPNNYILHATGGSGTDIQGANLTLAGGRGTGTGTGGSLLFQTAAAGASGATANTLSTVMTIQGGTGAATFQNVSNSASAFRVLNSAGTAFISIDTSNSTVLIGNTTGSTGVDIQAAGGNINIGNVGVNNTIQIGAANANNTTQTVNVGTNASGTGTSHVVIGSTSNTSSLQLRSGPGGNITIGDAGNGYSNTIQIGASNGLNSGQTINIGNNEAGTALTTTVRIGSSKSASITNLLAGSGGVNVLTGAFTLGTTSQAGSLVINDGTTNTVSIVSANQTGNFSATIPILTANDSFCFVIKANCTGGGGGANTSLSNLTATNINQALNTTSGNLSLTTTTSVTSSLTLLEP